MPRLVVCHRRVGDALEEVRALLVPAEAESIERRELGSGAWVDLLRTWVPDSDDVFATLDKVAYVRFASVYRNFREAKDFETFIGKLGSDED